MKRRSFFPQTERDWLDVSASRLKPIVHRLRVSLTVHERGLTRTSSRPAIAGEPFVNDGGEDLRAERVAGRGTSSQWRSGS
jgi:hypothetical protein